MKHRISPDGGPQACVTAEAATHGAAARLPYEAPTLEVNEYVVEQGYAFSNQVKNFEEFSEITDSVGQTFHGEWF